ncbi:MAG TPA: hypothetical protein VGR82_10785 [Methylomirabilota bacterium]|jgi:hypothetical protein|nr:hypothetical protein [Methylomirabilota bacterium]
MKILGARLIIAALILAGLGSFGPAYAGDAVIFQTQGLQATADAGESGASTFTNAIIEVQATTNGVPVDDLAPFGFTGNGTSVITLPSGWSLTTLLVAPLGCEMQPTLFFHPQVNLGYYRIHVVPNTTANNGLCTWKSGTYTYIVKFDDGKRVGTALGSITIP